MPFFLISLFLSMPWPALAQEDATASLVRQLGSQQFEERECAGLALEGMGDKALPALAQACRDPDIETRRRALLLHKRIQERMLSARLSGLFSVRLLPPSGETKDIAFLLEIRPDRKLEIQGLDGLRILKILGESGIPGPSLQSGSIRNQSDPGGIPCFLVPVKITAGDTTKKYQEIQGMLSVRILVKNPLFTVNNLEKDKGKKWDEPGGASLQILEVEERDDGDFALRLQLENFVERVQFQPGPAVIRRPGFIAFRGPADQAADCIEVQDSQGRPLPRIMATSQPLPNKTLTGIELRLTFQGSINPAHSHRLVFSAYQPMTLEIPFTLRNIALP